MFLVHAEEHYSSALFCCGFVERSMKIGSRDRFSLKIRILRILPTLATPLSVPS
jgi:hypothetical protein